MTFNAGPLSMTLAQHWSSNVSMSCFSVSVSVYYVAVRTIVLSRHGSSLARPVIIHDINHGLYMYQVLHIVDFLGSRRMETAPTSNSKAVRRAIWFRGLRGSLSPTGVYSTWQSQAVTHPIMNRARLCLTSVIKQTPMSERRIPLFLLWSLCPVIHVVIPESTRQ